MPLADRAVLVTGANDGIGQGLVDRALSRGGKREYVGTCQPPAHAGGRLKNLTLDVASATQIQAAVESVESLDTLINNAGDPMSASVAESWRRGAAKTLERQNAALLEAEPVRS
jgi:NAD(P)-dependent dehydrogenase (short-subunit alcohol dehydrogenase family)